MNTITIEIINDKVINILQELEQLNLIRILKKDANPPVKGVLSLIKKGSDYKGIISAEDSKKMLEHIRQSREEW